ncbi:MAG: hypothetical protein GY781_21565 [Gammaproteobacteria bacterium]|nr:hypothetical protein [Gammaproteobacteria bacterium]
MGPAARTGLGVASMLVPLPGMRPLGAALIASGMVSGDTPIDGIDPSTLPDAANDSDYADDGIQCKPKPTDGGDCLKQKMGLNLTKGVILELFDPLHPSAYNTAVISFNRKVASHNLKCPDHKVIPLNPILR